MFSASVLLDEYRNVDAESMQVVSDSVDQARRDLGLIKLDADAFGQAKEISIDFAVMEKTAGAAVVPVACGWSDVGSWRAVWELSDKDGQGNAAQGIAVFEDSRNRSGNKVLWMRSSPTPKRAIESPHQIAEESYH